MSFFGQECVCVWKLRVFFLSCVVQTNITLSSMMINVLSSFLVDWMVFRAFCVVIERSLMCWGIFHEYVYVFWNGRVNVSELLFYLIYVRRMCDEVFLSIPIYSRCPRQSQLFLVSLTSLFLTSLFFTLSLFILHLYTLYQVFRTIYKCIWDSFESFSILI